MQTDSEWKAFEALGAEARRQPARVEKLAYRAPGTTSVAARSGDGGASETSAGEIGAGPPGQREFETRIALLEEQLREQERVTAARADQARRTGMDEGRREAGEEGKAALDAAARQVEAALSSFLVEREEYFARVEQEVVRLALGIAARILNREASLDPLLLAGAVRVALGQLGETTVVELRCPVDQVAGWREMLGRLRDRAQVPEVTGDPAMVAGDCVLTASVGTVDLGVRAQLEEIERGFFDLLEQRPGAASRPSVEAGNEESIS